MNAVWATGLLLLAEEAPRNTGPDFGKASPFGLLIVVLLLIGTFFLVWSMNKHLRRLPESFESKPEESEETDGPDSPSSQERGGQPPG